MSQILDYALILALVVVFATLCFGIYSLFRGGDFSRSWSNKLMRARVVFQFVAIVLIVVLFWLKGTH
ncbi:twin transmembrane helix small protein [Woodsholea maritima]|uniref:twin transmembrane helix small protein n=1 Tax=Woodsholea maritima TaxID=240237 RepID=UPI000368FA23|nr:twin transmembrane helix small protein [Woodsholea maritima]